MSNHSPTYTYLLEKYGLTITWAQAATELGVYWENIRKLCKRGDIAAQKVGRSWMLTTKALADFIDNGSVLRQRAVSPAKARNHHKYVTL